ncbi:peroxisome assembly protein 10 [Nannizzia gypsea CBS 118893]|uniref:RING-type E3 ubiquitin transferase n=1 Tax=Arthroderma gypseum (strain ATCC MYA-4604 / CBS 118893) TaxID=535722 RepID=E4UX60_ARTGP|nr:peroxisome assembly protein 10 [Nannizzia gypsea CBS 118893]EFR01860.1 peroxisome assembly protein 10 [Nannizzia gypsea CBS 118893]
MSSDSLFDSSMGDAALSKTPKPSYFFPWATSPDIIRSHEKDSYITSTLSTQAQSIIRTLRGQRYAHTHSDAIKNAIEVLYLSLTTLLGNRTLGEEYCDVVQLEDDTLQLPSLSRRAGYIVSSILVPSILQRLLPSLRRKLRAKLERSIARKQARLELEKGDKKKRKEAGFSLRAQRYILEHLNSITSLSPFFAVNLAAFYFSGAYYHLSKRVWGLRYVFTKRIGDSEERIGYEVLGVLLVLQIVVQGIVHAKEVIESIQLEELESAKVSSSVDSAARGAGTPGLKSISMPDGVALLAPDEARYDMSVEGDALAMSWIPAGPQRKCTLCLDPFKDPSVSTCGHVFCWTCIRDWVQEKPECPLCRQEALASKILPLRG